MWLLKVDQDVGEYTVLRGLGRGAQAQVYAVKYRPTRATVAIKLLTSAWSQEAKARLAREHEAAKDLISPYSVRVLGFHPDFYQGHPAIAFEYVEGATLGLWLDSRGLRDPQSERLGLFQRILLAVGELHDKGFIHRDLKPGNILVERDGERTRPRVTDFGLVKLLGLQAFVNRLTSEGRILGTPGYMAPEQAEGNEVGITSDVFALGCVAYRLLTNSDAFSRDHNEALKQAQRGSWTRIKDIAPGTSRQVARAIEDCLSLDPNLRPQSCAILAESMGFSSHLLDTPVYGPVIPTKTDPDLGRASTYSYDQPLPAADSPDGASDRKSP